jgi:DNA-directed RNA polymerase subunit L
MNLEIVEKEKEKIKLRIEGETHTFINLLKENAWKAGAKQASYIIENPYLSEPKIIIRGKEPLKILAKASQMVSDQAKEFEAHFKRASGR